MRAWNRARLLWGYLRGQERLRGLPVEYIVETTAKCNLYCPMCPRETFRSPSKTWWTRSSTGWWAKRAPAPST